MVTGHPIDNVLPKLRQLRPNGDNSWLACCPAHDDRHPTLSVSVGDDGRVLLHCFAGCSSDLHAAIVKNASRPPLANLSLEVGGAPC